MRQKFVLYLIVSSLVLGGVFYVSQTDLVLTEKNEQGGNKEEIDGLNEEISSKRKRIKDLEASIESYKKKISRKRTEAVSLTNQISILDNRISRVELDIEATQIEIDTIELEIKALLLAIDDKEVAIQKQKNILAELIRGIHYSSNRKLIELLSAYDSFSDFYDQLQYLETIEEDLAQQTRALTTNKLELVEKKETSEERKLSYERLEDKLENKKKDLEENVTLKQDTLIAAQSSELKYQSLVSSLRGQHRRIEGEISGIEQEVRRRLESQNKLDESTIDFDGKLTWPTQSRYVTAYFHDPTYPYRHIFEHNAIDIRAAQGTPLKAAAAGYVGRAKTCSSSSCYSYVMLIHSGGLSTVYGHMSRITVAADQFVGRGDVIGYSGGTPGTVGAGPFVTGAHLHFEVRKNGIPVNPLNYLVKDY